MVAASADLGSLCVQCNCNRPAHAYSSLASILDCLSVELQSTACHRNHNNNAKAAAATTEPHICKNHYERCVIHERSSCARHPLLLGTAPPRRPRSVSWVLCKITRLGDEALKESAYTHARVRGQGRKNQYKQTK
jgi:uncharacterized protein YgiB involved in biofilm formation